MKLNSITASKINRTQLVALAAVLLSLFGVSLTEADQTAIITTIGLAGAALTYLWARWFTPAAKGSYGLAAIQTTQLAGLAGMVPILIDVMQRSGQQPGLLPDGLGTTPVATSTAIGLQVLTLVLRSLFTRARR